MVMDGYWKMQATYFDYEEILAENIYLWNAYIFTGIARYNYSSEQDLIGRVW